MTAYHHALERTKSYLEAEDNVLEIGWPRARGRINVGRIIV